MDLIQELVKTAIIALVSALATLTWAYSTDVLRKRKFRKVFGRGVVTAEDITVSVGLWQVLENIDRRPRFIKGDETSLHKKLYGPSKVYSTDDMVAASHLLNILSSHFGKRSTYINDRDSLSWDSSTIILLGSPLGNTHTRLFTNN